MAKEQVELKGSLRPPPPGAEVVGTPAPDEIVQLTVVLRRRNPLPPPGTAPPVSREHFARMYGADPADVQKLVTASADKIEKGFNPFTGPVTDNTGAVKIAAGESWGGDKMGNFDWYVEGVIGKAK